VHVHIRLCTWLDSSALEYLDQEATESLEAKAARILRDIDALLGESMELQWDHIAGKA
jgi:hypothetical protein